MCIAMKMLKKLAKSAVCATLILAISACSSVKVVTITGTPGTTIYSSGKWEIGKIGEDGTAQVHLDAECPYYLSKAPNSKTYVPFAVDIKDNFHSLADSHRSGYVGGLLLGIMLTTYSLGLLGPAFYQPDKPLDAQTNNDLIK